jgi:hypothetical protein
MDYIKECATTAHSRLDWLLELEGSPFTLNTHYFAEYKDKFMEYYRGLANSSENSDLASALVTGSLEAAGEAVRKGIPEALAALAKAGLRELATRDLAKLLVRNSDERALEVMAEVHAYYEGTYNKSSSKASINSLPSYYTQSLPDVLLIMSRETKFSHIHLIIN